MKTECWEKQTASSGRVLASPSLEFWGGLPKDAHSSVLMANICWNSLVVWRSRPSYKSLATFCWSPLNHWPIVSFLQEVEKDWTRLTLKCLYFSTVFICPFASFLSSSILHLHSAVFSLRMEAILLQYVLPFHSRCHGTVRLYVTFGHDLCTVALG